MAAKKKSKKEALKKAQSVVAKSDDGSVQITYTIPFGQIEKARTKAAEELGKNINVPGFRKGKAPHDVLAKHIDQNSLLEKTMQLILPKLVGETIDKEKIKMAMYPKFQLIKASDNEPWEVRAQTAEIPEFKLGKYKDKIKGNLRSKNLWVPGEDKAKEQKVASREEREQEVIKTLLEEIEVKIPKILLEEETNIKLARLIERLEKLGLNLDSYLASIRKSAADLRAEYEKQAKDNLALDLIFRKIADEENIEVSEADVDAAIKAASGDQKLEKEFESNEKRELIRSVLKKRAALNHLLTLS